MTEVVELSRGWVVTVEPQSGWSRWRAVMFRPENVSDRIVLVSRRRQGALRKARRTSRWA